MAFTIMFELLVFLLFRAALPLPVSQETKSLQLSRTAKITVVFDSDTVLSRDKDGEQITSFDSAVSNAGVKRTKREAIVGNNSCPQGMKWIFNRNMCVTLEKYAELYADDYDEITTTTQLPYMKPRPQTTSRPKSLLPSRTSPRPRSTSHHRTKQHRKTPRVNVALCHRLQTGRRAHRKGIRCRDLTQPSDVKRCRKRQKERRARHKVARCRNLGQPSNVERCRRRHRRRRLQQRQRAACQFLNSLSSIH